MTNTLTTPPNAPGPHTGAAPVRTAQRRKLVGTGIGNALEWFDWGVFAIFAPFFATQFFNPANPVSAFLSTLIVFAVGFAARPLGGLVFGWLADRRGRKFSMSATVGAAAAGSMVIGLSPTYGSIGVGASILLVTARLVQGLAHGGELPSTQSYLSESAPADKRGLWASLLYVSGTTGNVIAVALGAILSGLLTSSQMASYGWRIPFILGGLCGLYALVMRRRLPETEVFDHDTHVGDGAVRPKMWPEIVRYRRQGFQVVGLTVGLTVVFYIWAISAPAHAIATIGIEPTHALWAGVVANLIFIAVLPLWGILSDRVGRKPVLFASITGLIVATFPLSWFVRDSALQLGIAMTVAMVFIAGGAAIIPAVFSELFPTHIRTIGVGIPYSVAVAAFGGTAPYLQTWMGGRYGDNAFPLYVVVLLLVSAGVLCTIPETRGKDLHKV